MNASRQYDAAVAEAWLDVDELPAKLYAELPSYLAALGPLEGRDILDLACGTGHYCRIFAERGARHVLGVDSAVDMIAQARSVTRTDSERVQYAMHDVLSMPKLGEFDLVTGSFLLNYAQQIDQLYAMCRQIARHLRPGGTFGGSVPNPWYDRRRPVGPGYGVTFDWPHDLGDGDPYTFVMHLQPPLSLRCCYWSAEAYLAAFAAAGMENVTVESWRPSPQALRKHGAEYWQPWIDNPLAVVLRATKPPSLGDAAG